MGLSTKTKIGPILALIVLAVLMFTIFGCTAGHAQVTFGTGEDGTAAAAAMAAGEAWPAAPGGTVSSESKKSVSRSARD